MVDFDTSDFNSRNSKALSDLVRETPLQGHLSEELRLNLYEEGWRSVEFGLNGEGQVMVPPDLEIHLKVHSDDGELRLLCHHSQSRSEIFFVSWNRKPLPSLFRTITRAFVPDGEEYQPDKHVFVRTQSFGSCRVREKFEYLEGVRLGDGADDNLIDIWWIREVQTLTRLYPFEVRLIGTPPSQASSLVHKFRVMFDSVRIH